MSKLPRQCFKRIAAQREWPITSVNLIFPLKFPLLLQPIKQTSGTLIENMERYFAKTTDKAKDQQATSETAKETKDQSINPVSEAGRFDSMTTEESPDDLEVVIKSEKDGKAKITKVGFNLAAAHSPKPVEKKRSLKDKASSERVVKVRWLKQLGLFGCSLEQLQSSNSSYCNSARKHIKPTFLNGGKHSPISIKDDDDEDDDDGDKKLPAKTLVGNAEYPSTVGYAIVGYKYSTIDSMLDDATVTGQRYIPEKREFHVKASYLLYPNVDNGNKVFDRTRPFIQCATNSLIIPARANAAAPVQISIIPSHRINPFYNIIMEHPSGIAFIDVGVFTKRTSPEGSLDDLLNAAVYETTSMFRSEPSILVAYKE